MVLALITFYMGDAAGQGFLHGFAGMLLFMVALALIIALDGILRWIAVRYAKWRGVAAPAAVQRQRAAVASSDDNAKFSMRLPAAALLALMMVLSVGVVKLLIPHEVNVVKKGKFNDIIPTRFGDWHEVPSLPAGECQCGRRTDRSSDQPYDDVLGRTYVNGRGQMVMLALAYASEQTQDVKIHLPEVCYVAQGFNLKDQKRVGLQMQASGKTVNGAQFVATHQNRLEAVTYWVRIGDGFPNGGMAARLKIFEDGMAGRVSDGILVRASSLLQENDKQAEAFDLQHRFLEDLQTAVRANSPGLLVPV
jgi:EpsI family protein